MLTSIELALFLVFNIALTATMVTLSNSPSIRVISSTGTRRADAARSCSPISPTNPPPPHSSNGLCESARKPPRIA
jgi:hypothetical protein